MKIVHVIGSLDPAVGGPPVVAQALASAQAGLGHEVHLTSYAPPGGAARSPGAGMPHSTAVQLHLLPPPAGLSGRLDRLTAGRFAAVLRQVLAGAGAAHLHGVWDPLLRRAAAVARALGVGYAIAPHGMLDPWSMAQKRLKKRLALAMGFRRMLDRAAFLHALNDDEARLLGPLGLHCPVEVLPNGIFPEQFERLPPAGRFFASHPQVGGRPFILFLGRLHPKKGLDYLADAFQQLAPSHPDVQLVVAGPDDGALGPMRRQVEAADRDVPGLARRVHFVGPLYGADKLAALVDAAVFCLPSRQEGFSIAVTEALACGLPVVISDACHFPEVAAAGAGEVVPLEAGAVASALGRLLGDEAARRRMGEAGRRLVAERYTWPRIAQACVQAYRRRIG